MFLKLFFFFFCGALLSLGFQQISHENVIAWSLTSISSAGESHFGKSKEANVWRLWRNETEDSTAHPGIVSKCISQWLGNMEGGGV